MSIFWQTFLENIEDASTLSTACHSQNDRPSERAIQILEDMMKACIVDWKRKLGKYLALAEFANNNNYHSIIDMSLYEVMYWCV